MELRPIDATFLGLHQYDELLPDGGLDEVDAEAAIYRELGGELAGIEERTLDHDLAVGLVDLNRFQMDELRLWESLPDAPEQLGSALFLLFARDFAPLPERLEPIAARLEDAPRFLEHSRERLRRPVAAFGLIALEGAEALPALLDVIVGAADGSLRGRLERAASKTKEAVAEFETWIRERLLPGADPDFAIGPERFAELLSRRRLPESPDAILELGRHYLAEAHRQRQELLTTEWPGRTLEDVDSMIRGDHAETFGSALDDYRATIESARAFVVDHGLATIPPVGRLDVHETPHFLRPVIPFAAYEPAAHFDPTQLGIYIVTPPPLGAPLGKEHNRASILNTSVHEGYPGHHLQFVSANTNPSRTRLLAGFHAHEFIEGWAHYCEQLMYEEGFSARPEVRFVQLTDLIWRACRIVIDVELSSGRMAFGGAVDMLVENAGMLRANAEAEVKRYTYTPGYQLSYLYGKHLLLELRERRRRIEGAGFRLREFHDRLLYAGSVPAAHWDRLFEEEPTRGMSGHGSQPPRDPTPN
jgi:hypothetical protein